MADSSAAMLRLVQARSTYLQGRHTEARDLLVRAGDAGGRRDRLGRGAARAAISSGALVEPLTDRELAILRALAGSASQREIGAALYLSINTIKAYTKSLYRKLGVNSRSAAVATGRELGLI